MKFNMLLCWCIVKAASGIEEFYLLPVGHDLVRYGSIAVNTIVKTAAEKSAHAMFRSARKLQNSTPII